MSDAPDQLLNRYLISHKKISVIKMTIVPRGKWRTMKRVRFKMMMMSSMRERERDKQPNITIKNHQISIVCI